MEKQTGVKIPEGVVENSDALKREKKPLTTAQIAAFKKAKELNFEILDLVDTLPRNLAKYSDQLISDSAELMKSVALSNENRGEERIFYISSALGLAYSVQGYLSNLFHLSQRKTRNYLVRDRFNKMKKICECEIAQLAGWRDFTRREGHDQNM